MIPSCQRSPVAASAAKALFRRGLLDVRRVCSISPRSRTHSVEDEKFRDVSTQDVETVDPGSESGEMATVNPVRVTGSSWVTRT